MSITSLDKMQDCPTSDDVKDEKLKNLAERLKGDSEKETLTNILEWQDRNIQGWWERWALVVSLVFVAAFIFFLLFKSILICVSCLGAIALLTVVYLLIRYNRVFLGEKTIEKIFKFIKVVYYTFRLRGLPVDKILEYKLAVCRDYAKLTAALLFNIYPDSELYFIKIPRHVAVGIKIKNKIYVIDQHLPILTRDQWLIKQDKEAKIRNSRLIRDPRGKPMDVTFSKHVTILRKPKADRPDPEINAEKLEKLTEEIAKIFGIKQSSHKDEPKFKITLPNYAIALCYDDDEITKYSLIRAIKNKLESEFCSNMDKISKVNISQNEQNKRDLTMVVCLLM